LIILPETVSLLDSETEDFVGTSLISSNQGINY
jgi:hypothetical protein